MKKEERKMIFDLVVDAMRTDRKMNMLMNMFCDEFAEGSYPPVVDTSSLAREKIDQLYGSYTSEYLYKYIINEEFSLATSYGEHCGGSRIVTKEVKIMDMRDDTDIFNYLEEMHEADGFWQGIPYINKEVKGEYVPITFNWERGKSYPLSECEKKWKEMGYDLY